MITPDDALQKLEAALAQSPVEFLHLLLTQAETEPEPAWQHWAAAAAAIAAVLDTGMVSVREKAAGLRRALEQPPCPPPSGTKTVTPEAAALQREITLLRGEAGRHQDDLSKLLQLRQKRDLHMAKLAHLQEELRVTRDHINQLQVP